MIAMLLHSIWIVLEENGMMDNLPWMQDKCKGNLSFGTIRIARL